MQKKYSTNLFSQPAMVKRSSTRSNNQRETRQNTSLSSLAHVFKTDGQNLDDESFFNQKPSLTNRASFFLNNGSNPPMTRKKSSQPEKSLGGMNFKMDEIPDEDYINDQQVPYFSKLQSISMHKVVSDVPPLMKKNTSHKDSVKNLMAGTCLNNSPPLTRNNSKTGPGKNMPVFQKNDSMMINPFNQSPTVNNFHLQNNNYMQPFSSGNSAFQIPNKQQNL